VQDSSEGKVFRERAPSSRVRPRGIYERFVGASAAASLVWRPSENVSINPYLSYVAVGDELKGRGADNVSYAHLSIALRF
jgi:hypothetical protein